MQELRLAIIGLRIGSIIGRHFAATPRVRVVALCDLVEERMAELARDLAVPVRCYSDTAQLWLDAEIDAVFIATPNQFHVPVALEALRHGKHVLVIKPLAESAGSARTLVEAAEASGLVGMMSLSTRFAEDVQYLGSLTRAGDFGELYYARARSIRRRGIPAWSLGFILPGGGAFRDMGVHVLDAAWWLMGMPRPVAVMGVAGAQFGPRGQGFMGERIQPDEELARLYAVDDYAGGLIRFENGAALQVESFWASHQPAELQIELFGSEAGACLRPLTIYRTVQGAEQDTTVNLPLDRAKTWQAIAAHFAACILDGVPCEAPLRHGLIVQEMMEAVLASAASGREVRLDE
jgi:predicted dehydrogenase